MENSPPPIPGNSRGPNESPGRRSGMPGCIMGLIAVVMVGFVGFMVFMVIAAGAVASGAAMSGPAGARAYYEEIVEASDSGKKIAVIRVEGLIIGGDTPAVWGQTVTSGSIKAQLDKAAADDSVNGVILDVNSPGGEVIACDEIYNRIRQFRQTTGKPVVTCMHSFAASGGYYIAAPTDHIVANRMTLTGSIGVIIPGYNYHELLQDKLGISPQVYKRGEMKDMGSGARPTNEKEVELLQGIVDQNYDEFTKIVAEGRGLEVEAFRQGPAGDSRILTGQDALQLQLVDELGYFDNAIAAARRLTGDQGAGVVRYRYRVSPLDLLVGAQAKTKVDLGAALPVRGVQVKKGHPYFLYPGSF